MSGTEYRHGGVRALVTLHERHMRSFVEAWRRAHATGLELPPTDDPSCADLEALLRHVLGAARGYMIWLCGCLELEDPRIRPVPEDVAQDPGPYLEHLLERWDGPLCDLDGETADRAVFTSRWGVEYCIDGMLEHAVMHPIRHEHQLERLGGA